MQEAITQYGRPDIYNTVQGSQFTSLEFTQALESRGIRISMNGKGRWVDNVFVERLWEKHEVRRSVSARSRMHQITFLVLNQRILRVGYRSLRVKRHQTATTYLIRG